MNRIVVIAPHPDDETLGCGGTLLRWGEQGCELHWIIVTTADADVGFNEIRMAEREKEIEAVSQAYGFASMQKFGLPAARLEETGSFTLVGMFSKTFAKIQPETVLLPFYGDAHSDHRAVYRAAAAAAKNFRQPSVRRILAYETLSETEFGVQVEEAFRPTLFVDISACLDRKIEIMSLYGPELGLHPFPRSEKSMRAKATLRGAQAGCDAAEAFMILKEIES